MKNRRADTLQGEQITEHGHGVPFPLFFHTGTLKGSFQQLSVRAISQVNKAAQICPEEFKWQKIRIRRKSIPKCTSYKHRILSRIKLPPAVAHALQMQPSCQPSGVTFSREYITTKTEACFNAPPVEIPSPFGFRKLDRFGFGWVLFSWHRKAFGSAGGMTSVKAKGGQTFTDSFDNKMQEQPAKYLHKDSEQHNLPGALQGTLAHLTKHGNFCVNLVCVLLLLTAHDKREAASDCTEEQANLKSRGTKPTNRQSCLANTCPFKIVLSWREAIVVAADCNNCCCPSEGSWGLTHQFAQKRVHIHADSPKVKESGNTHALRCVSGDGTRTRHNLASLPSTTQLKGRAAIALQDRQGLPVVTGAAALFGVSFLSATNTAMRPHHGTLLVTLPLRTQTEELPALSRTDKIAPTLSPPQSHCLREGDVWSLTAAVCMFFHQLLHRKASLWVNPRRCDEIGTLFFPENSSGAKGDFIIVVPATRCLSSTDARKGLFLFALQGTQTPGQELSPFSSAPEEQILFLCAAKPRWRQLQWSRLDSKWPPAETEELSLPKAKPCGSCMLLLELNWKEGWRNIAPQRGQAAAGSVRALLSQLCAALAWLSAALWLCWNHLSPAEGETTLQRVLPGLALQDITCG
ncbi:hypothetical protein Anapl_16192 [Anas platyrhynchos]|uniref:Uncharacterized protein n=1 Tax=Anas platyrhynchos TaxID=8839 RepID=R0LW54_ANAPL|nr:hypothetical protein Anapl_16192 [Anas platyrhynchos]